MESPHPETHSIEREEFDADRKCVLRRNAKSQVKAGIAPEDAANIPSLCIDTRGIYSFPICPDECNEPYAFYKKKYVGCATLARAKSLGFSGVNLPAFLASISQLFSIAMAHNTCTTAPQLGTMRGIPSLSTIT